MMIEQLLSKPAAVVVASAEEKNIFTFRPSASSDLFGQSSIPIFLFEPPDCRRRRVLDLEPMSRPSGPIGPASPESSLRQCGGKTAEGSRSGQAGNFRGRKRI